LARIVDQLLVISRLDVGQAGIEREPVNLGRLAETTAEQMRLLTDERGIVLRFSVYPGVVVSGDRLRLKQILVNLLDNAIKYVPDNGNIELIVRGDAGRAVLAVSDNGIGISPGELPYIFDRFFRTDKARTRATGGAGLGLSIVKAIALAHGGNVSVTSKEGSGTTVCVEFPLAENAVDVVAEPVGSQRESAVGAESHGVRTGATIS
jgi:signal transduction histidine kinase